ncbi:MAG: signal transduction histidine kinase, partial [Pseudomonadales bacterium]
SSNSMLFCDKDLIFQAFANVVDNAIKFNTAQGTILIGLDVVNENALDKSKQFKFTAYDSGFGATPQDFEKLTQRFYREDKSRSKKGNGLGLSLVLAIVNLHEGSINFVDNPLGKASGFGCEIVLPQM